MTEETHASLVEELDAALAKRRGAEEDLAVANREVEAANSRVLRLEGDMAAGLAEDAALIARRILHIEVHHPVEPRYNADVASMIADAVEDLRHGAVKMRRGVFAVKEYDRWTAQRCDCPYGYGPRHGSHWLTIGLNRDQLDHELTPEEIAACIALVQTLIPKLHRED